MLKIGQEFSRNIYLAPTSKVSREFWSYKFVKSLNEYGSWPISKAQSSIKEPGKFE